MRLLITGAAGFTGSYVSKSAKENNYKVYELKSNLCNSTEVEDEIANFRPTHVIHLASISAVTHAEELAFYQVNLFGSLNLLKALTKLVVPPEKIILASSANVYGNTAVSPISEAQIPCPNNHYAVSKLSMEYLSQTYMGALPIVLARPFNYTGVGHDQRFIIPKLIKHFTSKEATIELGNINVEREFNDVRFVCEAYMSLLESGRAGEIYNICSGKPTSLRSVIDILRNMTNHDIEIVTNKKFMRDNEVYSLCGDPSKLISCIGEVNSISLEDTLGWMLDSFSRGDSI